LFIYLVWLVVMMMSFASICSARTVGDINGDGKVDITDAVFALQVAARNNQTSAVGDINGDRTIDLAESLYALQIIAGMTLSCDNSHLNLCTINSTCTNASGHWWSNNTCNSTQEPPSCDVGHLELCITNSSCTGASGYWWSNNTCNSIQEPPSCDASHIDLCESNNTCTTVGGYWRSDNTCKSTPDYSNLFSLSYGGSTVLIYDYYQAGSSFTMSLTNISVYSFICTRSEFYNGSILRGYTTNSSLLGGTELTQGERIGIQWTINSDQYNSGINFKLYLNHPETGAKLIVSYTSTGHVSTAVDLPPCDSSHLDLCTTNGTCIVAGGNWWHNNTCKSIQEVCSSTNLIGCTFENDCTSAGGYWWKDNTCLGVPETETVTNPITGKTWMDRNLGASRVATSFNDPLAYGDLYQWGRGSDGHQLRTSATTSSPSSSDIPGHSNFITNSIPWNWRVPQNDSLWQGGNVTNNPCPAGFRLPTAEELDNELASWSSTDPAGAFGSPLKLTAAGFRNGSSGDVMLAGIFGGYWSSTSEVVDSWSGQQVNNVARVLDFNTSASVYYYERGSGHSVRCTKD